MRVEKTLCKECSAAVLTLSFGLSAAYSRRSIIGFRSAFLEVLTINFCSSSDIRDSVDTGRLADEVDALGPDLSELVEAGKDLATLLLFDDILAQSVSIT